MEFIKKSVFIIAELSANHKGDIHIALDTIKAAKRAGADAVKLQTYTPDTMTLNVKRNEFMLNDTIWKGRYLHDLYQEAYTPWEWHAQLFEEARKQGLICFSSPFDKTAVDFLEQFDPPAYKIASFEITDIPLIKYVAEKGRPVIISTGIANEEDIELAIKTCKKSGNKDIALLKCTSSYPAPIEQTNLVMIKDMAEKYGVVTGLSDHTLGIIAPILSVGMGAKIIEKHFIIDRKTGGPDASFSLDFYQFKEMVDAVRSAEKAIGKIDYTLTPEKVKSRKLSRSIYVSQNVKNGDIITEDNICIVRPKFGLAPIHFEQVLGKKFINDYNKGEPLKKEMFN
jgi:pseudaminic acid synthase